MTRPRVGVVLAAAGTLSTLLGLAVVAGWLAGIEQLTTALPGLDPMAFNSAFAFVLLGLSLLALAGKRPRVGWVATLPVIAYGLVTLVQHAADRPGLFDSLLLSPSFAPMASRGSPNAALAFMLTGLAIVVLALGQQLLSRLAASMLATSAIVIGVVDLLAYLAARGGHQGSVLLPQMAVHAAFGVTVAAGALVYAGWYLPGGLHERPVTRAGFWAGLAVFVSSVFLAQLLRAHERTQIRGLVGVAAQGLADQFQRAVEERETEAASLVVRIHQQTPRDREQLAAAWLGPTLEGIALLRPGTPARWLVARPTEAPLAWWPDATLADSAAKTGRVVPAFQIDGEQVRLGLLAPDTLPGAGGQVLWIVHDLSHVFEDITASLTGRFTLTAHYGTMRLIQRGRTDDRQAGLWGATAAVPFGGDSLRVAVRPTPGVLLAARSILPMLTIASGTLVGILLGLSLAFAQVLQERTRELERANARLTSEIRERESVEATLVQREEELRQAHKLEAVGRLAGGIAHDYNNILTVIRSNARGLLLRDNVGDLTRDALEHIDRAAARGSLLTARLLAFSQRQLLQPETLSLGELVASLRDELGHLLGPHVRLLFERTPGVDLVHLDRRWITQVILDLAFNGREAMPLGGALWLRTRVADEALRSFYGVTQVPGPAMVLEIEDSGRGMDASTRARLFEPFFSTKRFGQGSGLALASAYGIIRQSGGEIAVRSEPERGTRVAIFLPLVDGPAPEVSHVNLAGLTVVVAEDEPGILRFLRRTLEQAGCRVIAGGSAEEALAALAKAEVEPDLLVSDIVMPGLSGVELADRLRERRPGLAVLFVSAYTSDALKQRGIESLAAYLLQKPFTAPELLEQVGRAVAAGAAREAGRTAPGGSPPPAVDQPGTEAGDGAGSGGPTLSR